ncbi:unnamed protein product [Peniophora sp. CBMAI 1063]|nr:unnamed protein product [Peniophora sp. CBMAI 1063]
MLSDDKLKKSRLHLGSGRDNAPVYGPPIHATDNLRHSTVCGQVGGCTPLGRLSTLTKKNMPAQWASEGLVEIGWGVQAVEGAGSAVVHIGSGIYRVS